MKINEMSIADLKASYDFTVLHFKKIKDEAGKVGSVSKELPLHKEMKTLKNKLYSELVTRVRAIK